MNHAHPGTAKIDLLVVLGIYVLAHGLMLLNNGVFWDDWVIVGGSPGSVAELYRQYGLPLFGYYHLVLDRLGIPAYRLLVFLSYLVSAACLYAILGKIGEIDRRTALVLVLCFALFPSNSARISIMASRIAVCYALFFLGFWLVSVYLDTRNPASRTAALVLLFASFLTHSLLVFYVVVLIYIAYHGRSEIRTLASLRSYVMRHLEFLLLPIVFWLLKLIYLEPSGEFRGYNRVTLDSALLAFSFIDNALVGGFINPLVDAFRISPLLLVAAAVTAILGARLLSRIDSRPPTGAPRHDLWFLLSGIVFFVAGVFPYLAVGKVPSAEDWDSRHQLLTPLGASFMLVYLVRLMPDERARNAIYALLLCVFLAGNLRQWVAFQKDWYKQVALIETFKVTPSVERGTRFVIDDRTADLDANNRRYRPYEFAGLFWAAFGDQKRLGRARSGREADTPEIALLVEHGGLELTLSEVLKLRVLESRDEPAFRARVRQVVRLSAGDTGAEQRLEWRNINLPGAPR